MAEPFLQHYNYGDNFLRLSTSTQLSVPNLPTSSYTSPTVGMLTVSSLDNLLYYYNGTSWVVSSGGGGTVSSVSNSDSSLTISPTTGAVVASINLANGNNWTATQNFLNNTYNGIANSVNGKVGFYNASNSNSFTIGTAVVTTPWNMVMPVDPGTSGYVLSTDGTGITSWIAAGTGSVTSVSGTSNRITSSGGATPVIDISYSYVGQSSITTLGTITTGTWHGTAIDLATYASGNLAVSHLNSGTSASSSTFWRGDGTWGTPTGVVTSVSNSDSSLTISPTTGAVIASLNVGHINTWSALQGFTANAYLDSTKYLMFNGSSDTNWRMGIIGTGAFTTYHVGNTSAIQIVTGTGASDGFAVGGTGATSFLEITGTDGKLWAMGALDVAGVTTLHGTTNAVGTITSGIWNGTKISEVYGGTNQSTYTTGDTLYASASNTLSKLAVGSNGQVLTLASGIPSWATPTTGTVTSVSGTANQIGVVTGTTTPVISIVTNPIFPGAPTIVSPGNSTQNIITTDATQTLTNKTLTTPVINGLATGTGVASAATTSTLMSRDSSANTNINNLLEGYTTTATAAGTTTLTVGSTFLQYFTGSTTQTITLPVTSTLVLGQQFEIVNLSSGALTVNSSGGNLVQTIAATSSALVTCILTSGTSAASWSSIYSPTSGTGAALTKTDDTNVTLTLGGAPTTALLSASSLTLGWTGSLAVNRGGTGGTSASITLFNNITGYTAAGATGTTSTNLVFSTSPTLVTPTLGVATATSINKVTITAPSSSATLTIADGASLITSGAFSTTITSSATTTVTLPTSGTLYGTASGSITSSQLATSMSDETGSGLLVFGTAPTFATKITIGTASSTTGSIDMKGTTSGTVTVTTAAAAGTWTMTLPTSAGTNTYLLQTDGSGVTSWVAPPSGSGITIGTTTITSGTTTKVLYDNAGVVGEYTISGSGNVAMTTSPTFTTPILGTPTSGTLTNTTGYKIDNLAAAVLNTITDGANFVYDGNNGVMQLIVLGAARTFTIANLKVGIIYTFVVKQDGTGSRVLTWGTTVKGAYGVAGVPPISSAASAIDKYTFIYDGTIIYCDYAIGYS